MSTASDITFNCDYCSSDTAAPDVTARTWQQWQCPHCASWNDWKAKVEPVEGAPFFNAVAAIVPMPMRMGKTDAMKEAITQSGNSRWNVADMQGNPIPDEVVRGPDAKAATLGLDYGSDMKFFRVTVRAVTCVEVYAKDGLDARKHAVDNIDIPMFGDDCSLEVIAVEEVKED